MSVSWLPKCKANYTGTQVWCRIQLQVYSLACDKISVHLRLNILKSNKIKKKVHHDKLTEIICTNGTLPDTKCGSLLSVMCIFASNLYCDQHVTNINCYAGMYICASEPMKCAFWPGHVRSNQLKVKACTGTVLAKGGTMYTVKWRGREIFVCSRRVKFFFFVSSELLVPKLGWLFEGFCRLS